MSGGCCTELSIPQNLPECMGQPAYLCPGHLASRSLVSWLVSMPILIQGLMPTKDRFRAKHTRQREIGPIGATDLGYL